MRRVAIGVVFLLAGMLPAQIQQLSPENRTVVIEPARLTEGSIAGHQHFILFRPGVDYAGLREASVDNSDNRLSERLRGWFEAGEAAGNVGDYYENRDHGHSRLNLERFGQLAELKYAEELTKLGADFGVKLRIVNERPTLINASLAMQGQPYGRSMARLILHNPELSPELYTQYRLSNICFYPEHEDFDPKHGDHFAVNTPYLVISQGSSGSDQPFLRAFAQTLAAFDPAVKERLHQQGLLAPALQMIFRWSNRGVGDADVYLTGEAHPAVFNAKQLDADAMVGMAHAMTMESLPPLAVIRMTREAEPEPGVDYFDSDVGEKLMDTPCAIGRIARSLDYRRTFRVSAADSIDVHQRPLNYHWVILRGDASKIDIRPLNPSKTEVEITVDYGAADVEGGLTGNRVDIGAFVDNGQYYSPPAFISIWYPPHEERVYAEDGRLLSVHYRKLSEAGPASDPVLLFDKPWTDVFQHDEAGKLTGWTREFEDGRQVNFNAAGERIGEAGPSAVTYTITPTEDKYRQITPE